MNPERELVSWGRVCRGMHRIAALPNRHAPFPALDTGSALAVGNGRSYGDSGLNIGSDAVPMRRLDRFIDFDATTGLLRCEAGILLDEILQRLVPLGWFLPVTPGTRYVTLGGAIANDVHGKNHHRNGSIGHHVNCLELLRSDGTRRICSPSENSDWLTATIGGLGLTGIITWAELRLRRVKGSFLTMESMRFNSLGEFVALCDESDHTHEYTVAWIDCLARGNKRGRGIFSRANHAPEERQALPRRTMRLPVTPPVSLVNPITVRAFNSLYFHRQAKFTVSADQHYSPFFYPLDGVLEWNRIYGPRGFHQYQCVIPDTCGIDPIDAMLQAISDSGCGSFLAVLKRFGGRPATGLMSFPLPGLTLALDFPETGKALHVLLARLDSIVSQAGGRIYPAKDSRMPASLFRAGYPNLEQFTAYKDPRISSTFWRRMMEPT